MRKVLFGVLVVALVAAVSAAVGAQAASKLNVVECSRLTVKDQNGEVVAHLGINGLELFEAGHPAVKISCGSHQRDIIIYDKDGIEPLMSVHVAASNKGLAKLSLRTDAGAGLVMQVADKAVSVRGQTAGGPVQTVLPLPK